MLDFSDFERYLRRPNVGFGRRAAALRSGVEAIEVQIAKRRRDIIGLQDEISALELRIQGMRSIFDRVESEKSGRSGAQPGGESRVEVRSDVNGDSVRFSDFPINRSGDGRTWSAPFPEGAAIRNGLPMSDFINDSVEFFLRQSGAMHVAYLRDKMGFNVSLDLAPLRERRNFVDSLLKSESCEIVFDVDYAPKRSG